MALPLIPHSYVNGSDMTYKQNRKRLQNAPANSSFKGNTDHFDHDLRNEKSFDLHMFTGNITTGIVTVNGYRKQ